MASKNITVPVMQKNDYRAPDSFVYYVGHPWTNFLKRWNDPDITTAEAKGLLHEVAYRIQGTESYINTIGEDHRETCVRFLLHYAGHPFRYDNEWQIIEKARQVLVYKVLDHDYIEDEASNELIIDILTHLTECMKKDNGFYEQEPYRRKIEIFLRKMDEQRGKNHKINELVSELITKLFRSKRAYKELRRGRL